jgi:salicylate biosynthesis isochorismate synthase
VRVGVSGAPAPRFVGGFAFAPGAARGAAWHGFADARFVLPRWTYARRGDEAWLTAVIDGDTAAQGRDAWHGELGDVLAALGSTYQVAPTFVKGMREADPAVWRRQIEDIRAVIRSGEAKKIVAARTCAVEMGEAIDAAGVIARLGERYPETTRFAIRAAGRVFVGASPERLVGVRGLDVATDALAGSIARSGRDDAGEIARLAASAKDRVEHEVVVERIRTALAGMCTELSAPATPSIRSLRNIHHLHTPVRGTLAARRHVVEIAAALHPTPAVGGTPATTALAWIAANEEPRGWYAAPVGWFDAAGDGELNVAIRSGVIDGATALLYAGCGIVADSDPDAELDESRIKLRPMLGALGAL